jgi:predicted dehydrogenase
MRIGILGAARIAPAALVKPARAVGGVEVAAVAARDRRRAEAFASRYGVSTVHTSYEDLIVDSSLDAVYIPLPNGLHAKWTLAAIQAGKHVLCEKPFTANAAQARDVATAAERASVTVMEAFHYRYHPLAHRIEVHTSMWSSTLLRIRARVFGERGTLAVSNFAVPGLPYRFTVTVDGKRRHERFDSEPTYVHQLRAFVATVAGEPANLTPPADSVATMSVIDAIYTAAGLPLRDSELSR